MNRKIVSVFICMLIIAMIPVTAGMNNCENKIEAGVKSTPIILVPILGLFPQVSENNITFWILAWITIQENRFRGYVGNVLIFGVYIVGGPI